MDICVGSCNFGKSSADFVLDLSLYNDYAPYSPVRDLTEIAESFQLLTSVLKFLGNSPVSARRVRYGPKNLFMRVVFGINWTSWSTLASATIAVLSIFIWLLFLLNIGLDMKFLLSGIATSKDFNLLVEEEEISEYSLVGMVRKTYIVTAVVVIIEIASRWAHAPSFTIFLNEWHNFEKQMAENFPSHEYDYSFKSMKKLRDKLLLYYVTYPSIVLLPTFLSIYCSKLQLFAQLLGIIICLQFITVALLEDVKVFLTYKSLSQAFYQVRLCIEKFSERVDILEPSRAESWRLLVLSIRNQCLRVCRWQKYQELTRLLGSMGLVTFMLYIILNGWDDAKRRGDMLFLMSCIGYSCMLIGRAYCKAFMAEQITHEEMMLARTISGMSTSGQDSAAILELKCLADIVAMKPVQISFGNYVVLNKRLLLGMSSQVMTYLIVLMQLREPLAAKKA